ncbi:MAG: sodium:glutamate symporter [Bacteroidales bacterium]|nr:sodium:glutamate symporter [Bacteroidales bacterium]
MTFTPWTLFTDLGIIAILLLIGKLLRVYVKLFQKLFIPPSIIAGALGLLLGPGGFDILPFSNQLGVYPAVLITFIFGALPLSTSTVRGKDVFRGVGATWAYSQLGILLQWGVMGLLGFTLFRWLWPSLNDAFAIMLPTGFYGGHGTAAAIGESFDKLGWSEAASLGMTTSTVGVLLAIVGGLAIVKVASQTGRTNYIADFDNLPDELRSGLVPPDGNRESSGERTTSSISIESLTFHFALVLLAAFGGWILCKGVKTVVPSLEFPVYCCSFIAGLVFKLISDNTRISNYIDKPTISSISNLSADLLVAFGIASIRLEVVAKYWLPLTILLVTGTIITFICVFFLSRRLFRENGFEKSIFAWGWWTGTMAMGIALLRISDPKQESPTLGDFALAYLPCAPVEILIISLAPIMYAAGNGLWFSIGCMVLAALVIVLSRILGWWKK